NLVFSTGNGNAISFADIDDNGGIMRVTLSVSKGTLTLTGGSGITVTGGADGTGTVTMTGTKAQINAAVAGLIYRGASNYNGSDTLTVTLNDNGNTGADPGTSGGATDEERTETIAITVNPVNDTPVASAPASVQAPVI